MIIWNLTGLLGRALYIIIQIIMQEMVVCMKVIRTNHLVLDGCYGNVIY